MSSWCRFTLRQTHSVHRPTDSGACVAEALRGPRPALSPHPWPNPWPRPLPEREGSLLSVSLSVTCTHTLSLLLSFSLKSTLPYRPIPHPCTLPCLHLLHSHTHKAFPLLSAWGWPALPVYSHSSPPTPPCNRYSLSTPSHLHSHMHGPLPTCSYSHCSLIHTPYLFPHCQSVIIAYSLSFS